MSKAKEKQRDEVVICPVGKFFLDLERGSIKKSAFFKHLHQSRIEFLKAVRSLVDERIEDLEKRASKEEKEKATKIEVE
jgi:hypothetical protein